MNKIKNWQIKKIGEICIFVGGGTPSKNNLGFWNGDIPWASIKDIKGQYLTKTSDYITAEGLKKSATNLAYPNEIILATRINPGRPIITKIETSINQDLKIVRPKIEIDNSFLFYLFLNIENDIIKLSNGTTVLGITLNTLNEIDVQLPSVQTQQAIVSKIEELFSELDKGIEDLKTAQQQLKTYRQSVLKWAFENLKNEKTIEEITLESLIGLVRSNAFQNFKEIGVPYVKMNNIDMNGFIEFSNLAYIEASEKEIEKYSLKKDDILLNTRNSFELVGKTGIVRENNENVLFNNNLLRIRVRKDYSPLFILFQLVGPNLRKQMLKEKKATTSVCALYQRDILPLRVKITNIKEQDQIVQEIESRLSVADKMEESIEQSLQQAEALRQSILKKAFSGELV